MWLSILPYKKYAYLKTHTYISRLNKYRHICSERFIYFRKHIFNAAFYRSIMFLHVSVINVLVVINAFMTSKRKRKLRCFSVSHYIYGSKVFHLVEVIRRSFYDIFRTTEARRKFSWKPKICSLEFIQWYLSSFFRSFMIVVLISEMRRDPKVIWNGKLRDDV